MDYRIVHHGGHTGVTGSCHELRIAEDAGILVDCGLFQGDEERGTRDGEGPGLVPHAASRTPNQIDFPIGHIRALVVTHVHLDHVGRIPLLLAAGYDGPILCSEPSAILLPLMLEDALKVGVTRDRRLIETALERVKRLIVPLPYGRWHEIPAGEGRELAVKLQPAGHILGSAYVECRVRTGVNQLQITNHESRVIFSGDLGAPYAPLLPAPKSPWGADVVVLESTYGDREHEGRRQRRRRLQGIIESALADRGTILVPSFAIGRTQELLYELEDIVHRNRGRYAAKGLPWEDLEIVVDSPLAGRFTEAYRTLRPFWDAEAKQRVLFGRHPLAFEQMTTVGSHDDHENAVRLLARSGRPCIVVAGSGMCTGGRIVNYLKALIGDPRTDIVFVGYQARGTPGRAVQKYGPGGGYVVLDGRRYDIAARVHTLGGYSAHADRTNLVNFIRRMRRGPAEIRLVHGDDEARAGLAAALAEEVPGVSVVSAPF
ncbi:MBL fold metallo-hydrolase RNA specificity domain-containing protein [Desulfuromonas sp. TF]|uniref:MBL fold metallo-hydrolase RNA specificity domain-containing protein n=1 Tax=Desulfuromonas sp. TF TaxID=1232410 RepID=UPI000423C8C9|nr:MBL fold metallo-hydrolase [Desulfuromonas sp. TF]